MPEFVPTPEQKAFVAVMAGARMTWDEIAAVIINPRTGTPVSKETLGKAFAPELATGKQRLKSKILSEYFKRLNAGDWNAITFGLRHINGFKEGTTVSVNSDGEGAEEVGIQVTFVKPPDYPDDD